VVELQKTLQPIVTLRVKQIILNYLINSLSLHLELFKKPVNTIIEILGQ